MVIEANNMRYTNKHGLSRVAVDWLLHDEYDYVKGVISATTLLKPIRSIILGERHHKDMIMDVSGLIASRYGTAIHSSFEQVPYGEHIKQEERLFAPFGDVKVSGKYDMIEMLDSDFRLIDLKSTSVWKYLMDDLEEFRKQLSIYRYLLDKHGCPVRDIARIIMVFTDWSKKRAMQGGDYPPIRMAEKDMELMPLDETEEFIQQRLDAVADAKKLDDDDLPFCTDDELWKDVDKFAHMRTGRASAVKLYDTEEDAVVAVENDPKGFLEVRKGVVKRCPTYCTCHPFCNQFKQMLEDGLVEEPEEVDERDII